MSNDRVGKALERVAQQIVFCNCTTEGPALRPCEHVRLFHELEERLGPLLRAGQAMRDSFEIAGILDGDDLKAWDAAFAALERET